MDHVLTLREHEAARIGERWDPEARQLPEPLVAQLERLQAGGTEKIFAIGRREIVARQYVGSVGLGSRGIDLLPKVDTADNPAVRRHLLRMLAAAGLVPALESGELALGAGAPTLLDAFMALYVRRLALEWRRGPIRDYRKDDRQRRFLRGKLLFQEQLRRNRERPERVFSRADELVRDVPLARLLKAGLRTCADRGISDGIRHAARELLPELDDIQDAALRADSAAHIVTDRRTARFRTLAEFARLLLAGRTPDGAGAIPSYSLVFDMNVVFERYVGNLLRRAVCPPERRAELQVRGGHLLVQDGRPRFSLRPDVGIYRDGALQCLVDTKWKRLDLARPHAGVSMADVYQMYAYGKEYACPLVVLLYPRHGDLPERIASYRHPPGGPHAPRVEVCTLDVGHAADPPPAGQLERLLGSLGIGR